jgi:hypothetical protein
MFVQEEVNVFLQIIVNVMKDIKIKTVKLLLALEFLQMILMFAQEKENAFL